MRWPKKNNKHVILVSDWLKLKKIFLSETASLSYMLVVANNVSVVHHRSSSFHNVTVKNMATMGWAVLVSDLQIQTNHFWNYKTKWFVSLYKRFLWGPLHRVSLFLLITAKSWLQWPILEFDLQKSFPPQIQSIVYDVCEALYKDLSFNLDLAKEHVHDWQYLFLIGRIFNIFSKTVGSNDSSQMIIWNLQNFHI